MTRAEATDKLGDLSLVQTEDLKQIHALLDEEIAEVRAVMGRISEEIGNRERAAIGIRQRDPNLTQRIGRG